MFNCGATSLKPGQEPTVRVTLDIPANHLAAALARLPESVQVWVKEAVQLEPVQQLSFPSALGPEFAEQLAEAKELQKRQVEATERLAERK